MNFRAPRLDDLPWMLEEYQRHWPEEYYTSDTVKGWIRRWIARTDEVCHVAEISGPIGLISYRVNWIGAAYIDNHVVRTRYQGKGYGKKMWQMLKDELVAKGAIVAEFKSRPGVVRNLLGTKFQDIDGVHGRVTPDMEI